MLKQALRKSINMFGYELSKKAVAPQPIQYPYINTLELILQDYRQRNPDIFFIQIGAHDGKSADPIHHLVRKYHWHGILVEPQPQVFNRLKTSYEGEDQLIFENCLISYEDGMTVLYTIRDDHAVLPFWLSQSASLSRDSVLGALHYWKYVEKLETLPDNYDTLIEAVPTPAKTMRSLLTQYHIQHVDLLIIDTMGFDFEILKLFPFSDLKPAIIHFEHSLLNRSDQNDCFQYLAHLGYGLTQVSVDTIAYLNAPIRPGLHHCCH
jgi:FkbM family methyltransferase